MREQDPERRLAVALGVGMAFLAVAGFAWLQLVPELWRGLPWQLRDTGTAMILGAAGIAARAAGARRASGIVASAILLCVVHAFPHSDGSALAVSVAAMCAMLVSLPDGRGTLAAFALSFATALAAEAACPWRSNRLLELRERLYGIAPLDTAWPAWAVMLLGIVAVVAVLQARRWTPIVAVAMAGGVHLGAAPDWICGGDFCVAHPLDGSRAVISIAATAAAVLTGSRFLGRRARARLARIRALGERVCARISVPIALLPLVAGLGLAWWESYAGSLHFGINRLTVLLVAIAAAMGVWARHSFAPGLVTATIVLSIWRLARVNISDAAVAGAPLLATILGVALLAQEARSPRQSTSVLVLALSAVGAIEISQPCYETFDPTLIPVATHVPRLLAAAVFACAALVIVAGGKTWGLALAIPVTPLVLADSPWATGRSMGWACTDRLAFLPPIVAVLAALAWLPWVLPALRFVMRSGGDAR